MPPPLAILAYAVALGVPPPFDWVVEHAPRGRFSKIWNASPRGEVDGLPRALFVLATAMHGVDGIRRAAVATARAVVPRSTWGDYTAVQDAFSRVTLDSSAADLFAMRTLYRAIARLGDKYLAVANLLYFATDFPTSGLQHIYADRFFTTALPQADEAEVAMWVKTTPHPPGTNVWEAVPDRHPVSRRVARGIVKAIRPTTLPALLESAERHRVLLGP